MMEPSLTPATKGSEFASRKPGLEVMASRASTTCTPVISVSVAFQLQVLVTPSSVTYMSRPAPWKKEYRYHASLIGKPMYLPAAAAFASMPSSVCTSSAVKYSLL